MLHLDAAELLMRNLTQFSRNTPSLLQLVQLFDRDGKQVWPPKVPRDMSMFDGALYADPRRGPDWWKFAEADAAHARAESQRVQQYYEQQNKEREARAED
jgi:hypothetical protein